MRKLALALVPLLAACAATPQPRTAAPPPARTTAAPPPQTSPVRPAVTTGFRAPRVMRIAGLEDVIGKNGTAIANMFGTPRLEVKEGDARKLQFAGNSCVLDVYLYPLTQGAEPSATYVDARRASDGLDVDRAACVKSLRR
ncbi:hypothetical protein [Qipengyuania marisflavi]|uniref:DUF3035 domain-containing protein n=1 Tax=Qipengyuania marisflavi TaxID=2486356 RepID=A0A5S3P5D6_9SPHN|nr:hypothetical protein [Qipengyuania marisflavi]TMM48250.1 hypothetical protein FEV51_08150 [Qipengyuania marisflavi]